MAIRRSKNQQSKSQDDQASENFSLFWHKRPTHIVGVAVSSAPQNPRAIDDSRWFPEGIFRALFTGTRSLLQRWQRGRRSILLAWIIGKDGIAPDLATVVVRHFVFLFRKNLDPLFKKDAGQFKSPRSNGLTTAQTFRRTRRRFPS